MNQYLKTIQDQVQQNTALTEQEKSVLCKALADADKQWSITEFKLDRTEKVKRTTGILLEETIEELEQKRKAVEAQNRELEIESSLERVRAKTMAMQKPSEFVEVINAVGEQFIHLGFEFNWVNFSASGHDISKGIDIWNFVVFGEYHKANRITIPVIDHPVFTKAAESVNEYFRSGEEFSVVVLNKKDKDVFVNHLFTNTPYKDIPDEVKKTHYEGEGYLTSNVVLKDTWLSIGRYSKIPFTDEQNTILKKLANAFGQAHTRFLDLQNAEAQAREAQIQLALERVRARTMAMQKSEELPETSKVLYDQMKLLGEPAEQLSIGIIREEDNVVEISATLQGSALEKVHLHSTDEPYLMNKVLKAWKAQQKTLIVELKGEELNAYNRYRNELTKSEMFPTNLTDANRRIMYAAFFSKGLLSIATNEPRPPESLQLLARFASVFDLTYTRFLDLKTAEAQAREAQIEVALERVRSRAMAMQSSEELNELIGTVFTELTKLDLVLTRCVIIIYEGSEKGVRWWMANSEAPSNPMNFFVKYADMPFFNEYFIGWQERALKWQYLLEGENKIKTDEFLFHQTELSQLPDFVIAGMRAPERVYLNASFNNFGNLTLASLEPLSDEQFEILLRFAKVFDLTYTRFNDLQQAEAQAKEATIETALERVRGKAMAMHNSNDLSATASMVFTELRKLGISPIRCGVGLLNKESHKAQLYSATSSVDGDSLSLIGWVMLEGHPVLEKIYGTWLKQQDYFPELIGEQLKSYYELLLAGLSVTVPDWKDGQKQFGHFFNFPVGCLYAWSENPYNDNEIKILKRFAAIIDLTFRRYIELQIAEASAKEAVKQAALDRIRADIASMRTVNDLERITPLIWNELTILGIPFIRCGVFIMDDEQQLIHTFLSTPDGKAIAAFHIPYNTPGNIHEVLSHWKNKERYLNHWDEAEFNQFGEILVKQGALDSSANYLKTIPHGGFYLHFLPFLQGMLYVGNTNQLSDEEINLIQSVADAFSTAYARYEDFNKLEAAKQQVDKTLIELKQAQAQLVQSEKMASLGELTAGIAHEIQNPLNFVNNFSEVSVELVDELKEELAKGNQQDVYLIGDDLKDNLQKITEHGKRAASIVRGMLQHSRKGSDKKEPIDINALVDEYVRLSYHGLRAKDKSFNATLETKFDESVGSINIIPQDIGRVLLNLLNNAFYAVNEKKKKNVNGYEPLVQVSTSNTNKRIEIKIKDNGTGIPEKVLEKIYQPFFTTKPTGEGTGLGLSLSYDIITKGHGGEMKVETKEGEGSEFVVILPTVQ